MEAVLRKKKGILCRKLKFIYVYVPKCASSSLKHWIYKIDFDKEFKSYTEDNKRIHIHNCQELNHFLFSRTLEFKEDYNVFAAIRDPIKRLISTYSNRVIFHKELSKNNIYSDKIETAGLKLNPDINYFVEHLEEYQDCTNTWTILHHTRPIIDFLGEDISLYTKIYPIEDIDNFKSDVSLHCNSSDLANTIPEIPRKQTGGPKLKLNILKPENFDKLVEYYAKDYELLRHYYSLKKIKEEYILSLNS